MRVPMKFILISFPFKSLCCQKHDYEAAIQATSLGIGFIPITKPLLREMLPVMKSKPTKSRI